jgi:hypothetical protein
LPVIVVPPLLLPLLVPAPLDEPDPLPPELLPPLLEAPLLDDPCPPPELPLWCRPDPGTSGPPEEHPAATRANVAATAVRDRAGRRMRDVTTRLDPAALAWLSPWSDRVPPRKCVRGVSHR